MAYATSERSFTYDRMGDMLDVARSGLMVVLDYSKCVEAIIIEERATSELPTTEDLLARKHSPTCPYIHEGSRFASHALQGLCAANHI